MGKETKKVDNMTVKKRSEDYAKSCIVGNYPEEVIEMVKNAYNQGAKDQRKLDIDEGCEWILSNFSCPYMQSTLYYCGILHQPKEKILQKIFVKT